MLKLIRHCRLFTLLTIGFLLLAVAACSSVDSVRDTSEVSTADASAAAATLPAALKPLSSAKEQTEAAQPATAPAQTADTDSSNLPTGIPDNTAELPLATAPPVPDLTQDSEVRIVPELQSTNTPAAPGAEDAARATSPATATVSTTAATAVSTSISTRTPLPAASAIPQSTNTPAPASETQATATKVSIPATATKQPAAEATATTAPANSSAVHFSNCTFRTGNNATIAIPGDTIINGGLILAPGDEVAIFTPDGALCAGVSAWTGKSIAVTAWGDDSQTDASDGLSEGETMQFRIWDASEAAEFRAADVTYSIGDGLYVANSIHAVSAMTIE